MKKQSHLTDYQGNVVHTLGYDGAVEQTAGYYPDGLRCSLYYCLISILLICGGYIDCRAEARGSYKGQHREVRYDLRAISELSNISVNITDSLGTCWHSGNIYSSGKSRIPGEVTDTLRTLLDKLFESRSVPIYMKKVVVDPDIVHSHPSTLQVDVWINGKHKKRENIDFSNSDAFSPEMQKLESILYSLKSLQDAIGRCRYHRYYNY